MGSFVTLDFQCLSSLLEVCHNCSTGKTSEVSIAENLSVRIGTEVIRPITFVCCGLIINAEGAIFWHSSEITSQSIANDVHKKSLQKEQEENTKVIPDKNVIFKCEEKATEKLENEEDSVKILVEEDPLLLDLSNACNSHSVKCIPTITNVNETEDTSNRPLREKIIGILSNQDAVVSKDLEKLSEKEDDVLVHNKNKSSNILQKKMKYPEMFTCEFCGKNFIGKNRAYLFYYHRNREHTKEMVFRCEICFKDFYGDRELLSHMSMHNDPGHVCHVCGKKLTTSKHLKAHLLIHEPVREHTCEYCDKMFRRKDHLRVHERIHTGERPYQCRWCGSAYPQNHQLKLHLQKCPILRS